MPERQILIGTGFYAKTDDFKDRQTFFREVWLQNLDRYRHETRIFVIDNSDASPPATHMALGLLKLRGNLGHSADTTVRGNRIMGWAASWIIPALIAYSENCDFVYKEQDCLAFGDWLPEIKRGRMAFGKSRVMPCEQSLFWIERDFIPDAVAIYCGMPLADNFMLPEEKFMDMKNVYDCIEQFDMSFGRDRPIDFDHKGPWYAQKFTEQELEECKKRGLI